MNSTEPNKPYRVLSIDGGGVRGIIPARILQELEHITGQPICELFDLIVGTSTGGLIALALTTPNSHQKPQYSAADILQIYLTKAAKIFPQSLWRKISTGGGLWGAKYDRASYDRILAEIFGDLCLSQTLKPVAIPAYSLDDAAPHFFTSLTAQSSGIDFYLKDIAAATSAAPTYFPPKSFQDSQGQNYCEADGGIYANNPEALAVYQAFKLNPSLRRSNIYLLSIGTGRLRLSQNSKMLVNAGVVGWVIKANLIDVIMNADSAWYDTEVSNLYPATHRLQVTLAPNLGVMDNTEPLHLQALVKVAETYLRDNGALWQKICQIWLEPKASFEQGPSDYAEHENYQALF